MSASAEDRDGEPIASETAHGGLDLRTRRPTWRDAELLQQLRGALDLLEQPEQVAHVDADVAGHVGVVAEVVGHVLPDAVEVHAHEPALAVDRRAARVAAGGVAVGQEADRHLAERRVRPAAEAPRREGLAHAGAGGRTAPRRCASRRRRRASSAGSSSPPRAARSPARGRRSRAACRSRRGPRGGRPRRSRPSPRRAQRGASAPAAASRRSLRAFRSASRARPRSSSGSFRARRASGVSSNMALRAARSKTREAA